MSVDKLIEKTTIDFPVAIGRRDAENMLGYISSHLPGNVSGKVEYFINYIYDTEKKSSLEDKGTLKLVATIKSLKETMAFGTFISKPWEKNTSWISGVEFQRVPDWELSESRPEVRELWKDVRKIVSRYFSEILKTK